MPEKQCVTQAKLLLISDHMHNDVFRPKEVKYLALRLHLSKNIKIQKTYAKWNI